MICDRCRQDLTLGQWADDWCPVFPKATGSYQGRHTVTGPGSIRGEQQLREAFQREQMEAIYARNQM